MRGQALTTLALMVAYAALAVLHTWPLALHLGTHFPGRDLGDNATFVWNLWWMREALASPAIDYFQTNALFAPVGTSLILHTHTALNALIGATLFGGFGLVTAQNILLLVSLVLNGLSGYVLARLVTGATLSSAMAGAILVVSPVVTTRLMGHFNLVALWPLVLGCTAIVWWRRRPSFLPAAATASAAGLLPYVDYYLTIYFWLFGAAYLLATHVIVKVVHRPRRPRLSYIAMALACAAFAVAAAIALSPSESVTVGRLVVSVRSPTNALSAGWLLLAVAVLMGSGWRVRTAVTDSLPWSAYRQLLVISLGIAVLIAAPIAVGAWQLWTDGSYITSPASIRSGPQGLDVATVIMGPPFNALLGGSVRHAYTQFGIDAMESSAWVGAVVLVLVAIAWRAQRHLAPATPWVWVTCVFALWALGPSLMIFGRNSGLLLPQLAARFVPVVNNARMPGRALLVVAICLTVIGAFVLQHLRATGRAKAAALLFALVILESLAAPLPLVPLRPAGVHARLASDGSAAAVLAVPFGIRDGFGQRGRLEHDALYAQTTHGHPIAGGFVARMSPAVAQWYASHPLFVTLQGLSEGREAAMLSCAEASAGLRSAGVGFVVLYRRDASPELRGLVEDILPIRKVAEDDERVLFETSTCVDRAPLEGIR